MLSLCALSTDELLLACGDAGLRVLSLHTGQLVAREPIAMKNVWQVAFDARTGTLTLLVKTEANSNWQLVSRRRNARECHEVQRLNADVLRDSNEVVIRVAQYRKFSIF